MQGWSGKRATARQQGLSHRGGLRTNGWRTERQALLVTGDLWRGIDNQQCVCNNRDEDTGQCVAGAAMGITTPDWVKHSVFYQIFPDRFSRSPRLQHPPGIRFQPWGAPPTARGFQGGDLLGVVDRLDYLEELGVNALYLNPIFSSASNHRYHTYDYFQVDPLLGGEAAFRELLDEAHARAMRVIIDGVFNHTGRGFWAFHHILETNKNSPYLDWFRVRDWPLRPYQYSEESPHNYAAWWELPALPQLNVSNAGVRQHLLEAARHWIEFGADGWRLDVPEEIDDPPFWQEFRRVVKDANPDAYTVGEIWHEADEWLRGDRFDAVMNYVFSRAAYGYFGAQTLRRDYRPGGYTIDRLETPAFAEMIERMLGHYDWQVVTAQLNLLTSHDTARSLWTLNGDASAVRLCVMLQMTLPGAPCIYYGEEIGMSGGPDPGCRGAFPWEARTSSSTRAGRAPDPSGEAGLLDAQPWDGDLLDFHRQAITLRHSYPALRTGAYKTLLAAGEVFGFSRSDPEGRQPPSTPSKEADSNRDRIIVLFNRADSMARVAVPLERATRVFGESVRPDGKHDDAKGNQNPGQTFRAIWPPEASGQVHHARDGTLWELKIPARQALILKESD